MGPIVHYLRIKSNGLKGSHPVVFIAK